MKQANGVGKIDFPLASTAIAAKAKIAHLREAFFPKADQEPVAYSLYERGGFFFMLEEVEKAIEQMEAHCAAIHCRLHNGER
jgi:hypothetical protein